jgi:hypothetical protein
MKTVFGGLLFCLGSASAAGMQVRLSLFSAPAEAFVDPSGHGLSVLDVPMKPVNTFTFRTAWGARLIGDGPFETYRSDKLVIQFFRGSSAKLGLDLLTRLSQSPKVELFIDGRYASFRSGLYQWIRMNSYYTSPKYVYVDSGGWVVPLNQLVDLARALGVESALSEFTRAPSCRGRLAGHREFRFAAGP